MINYIEMTKKERISKNGLMKIVRLANANPKLVRLNPHWSRIYIENKRGVSLGIISVLNGEYYTLKCYKKDFTTDVVDETDYIFIRFEAMLNFGFNISDEMFGEFLKIATDYIEFDFEQRELWRKANPKKGMKYDKKKGIWKPKTRKKLIKKNLKAVLKRMIFEYIEEMTAI